MTAKKETLFGIRVKNRLRDMDKTQTWLAERLCLSNNAVSKWMKGESEPKYSNLKEIAKNLDCSVGYLVGNVCFSPFEDSAKWHMP